MIRRLKLSHTCDTWPPNRSTPTSLRCNYTVISTIVTIIVPLNSCGASIGHLIIVFLFFTPSGCFDDLWVLNLDVATVGSLPQTIIGSKTERSAVLDFDLWDRSFGSMFKHLSPAFGYECLLWCQRPPDWLSETHPNSVDSSTALVFRS